VPSPSETPSATPNPEASTPSPSGIPSLFEAPSPSLNAAASAPSPFEVPNPSEALNAINVSDLLEELHQLQSTRCAGYFPYAESARHIP